MKNSPALEPFRIYVEQLRRGVRQRIDATAEPGFMEIAEGDELQFEQPVRMEGEAYLADDSLVIYLDLETEATLPCSICNERIEAPVRVEGLYHLEPLEDISTGVFQFEKVVREAILLEAPSFAECNGGNCSKRKEIAKYLVDPEKVREEETQRNPFADL